MNEIVINFDKDNKTIIYEIEKIYDFCKEESTAITAKVNNVKETREDIYTILAAVFVNWKSYFDHTINRVIEKDTNTKLEILFSLDVNKIKKIGIRNQYERPLGILEVRFLDNSDKDLTKEQKENILNYFEQSNSIIEFNYNPVAKLVRV
jgi:hypothetical protein